MWSLFMVMTVAVMLPAISSAVPRPNVTRHQYFSSALTGVVVIGINKSNTIWCSARNRAMGSRKLLILRWLYSNRTGLPAVDRGQSSDHEVYMERHAGSSDQDYAVWRRVLHFKTTKPTSAGNYTCVANYKENINSHQSVEIQVSDIDCGDPGTPTNGDRHPFSTVYTSEVLYQCSMGYTLQGSDRRTCLSSGQWSGHLPQCNATDCSDPGTPTNGQRSLSNTTYNSVVTYTCDVGYTLQGSNSRTCQSDGQWSASVPQCTFMASIYSLSALRITLPLDSKIRGGTSFTVWYSTDGHDRDPSTPPQGALMVSTGPNSTSVTIILPESDNSCKLYYVWIAGLTPNGQQGPYSKRRQVEVCKAYRGQSTCGAASAGATVAGSLLGGAVVGGFVALLVVGILCGSWKLKHSGSGKSCEVNSEEEEKTYDTVGPKEPTVMCDHVAMETNPAYGVCS